MLKASFIRRNVILPNLREVTLLFLMELMVPIFLKLFALFSLTQNVVVVLPPMMMAKEMSVFLET